MHPNELLCTVDNKTCNKLYFNCVVNFYQRYRDIFTLIDCIFQKLDFYYEFYELFFWEIFVISVGKFKFFLEIRSALSKLEDLFLIRIRPFIYTLYEV